MTPSILILKRDFASLGGAEKYARRLSFAFAEKRYKVTLLTTGPTPSDLPFEVITQPLKSKTSVGKIKEFDRFCQEMSQSLPHDLVFGLDRNLFQTHLRAGSGVHRAFLEHRKKSEPQWKQIRHFLNPLHRTLLSIEKKSFEHPALQVLFVNSHLVKQEILSHYSVDEKKIVVIHNGVEWNEWQRSFDEGQPQGKNQRFEFLFVGNNWERKGLKILLKGLSLLSSSDFHLSVVGADKNAGQFAHLAEQLGLRQQVTFYGSQKEIAPFYQKADCLVIPSFYDPFANVTVEALAMGLFVVSSKTNGGSEVLTPKTGCIIPDLQNEEEVAHALLIALNHPKTRESSLAIRRSIQHLDFSSQLNAYLEKCL